MMIVFDSCLINYITIVSKLFINILYFSFNICILSMCFIVLIMCVSFCIEVFGLIYIIDDWRSCEFILILFTFLIIINDLIFVSYILILFIC